MTPNTENKQEVPVWICPWGICNHEQAQECRAEMKARKGCGGRFPSNMTAEQAKEEAHKPFAPSTNTAQPSEATRAPMAVEALAAFDEALTRIGGCTDGNCRIKKPKGMHTNGGCHCFKDGMKMQRYINAVEKLRVALASHAAPAVESKS